MAPDARSFTMLVDQGCPLCRREAALLARLDRGRGRLVLVDISSPGFDPSEFGCTQADLMASIHGVTAEGRIVTGMDVFRGAWSAVGMGGLMAPTAWPGLRSVFDRLYDWFASNRLRLTGREAGCADRTCVRDR